MSRNSTAGSPGGGGPATPHVPFFCVGVARTRPGDSDRALGPLIRLSGFAAGPPTPHIGGVCPPSRSFLPPSCRSRRRPTEHPSYRAVEGLLHRDSVPKADDHALEPGSCPFSAAM